MIGPAVWLAHTLLILDTWRAMFGWNARARRNAFEAWRETQVRARARNENVALFAAAIQAREEARTASAVLPDVTVYPQGPAAASRATPGGGIESATSHPIPTMPPCG